MFAGDHSRKTHAGRARLSPAQRPRQSAAAFRRMGKAASSRCCSCRRRRRPYELERVRRRSGRAGDPADGPGRSGVARQAGARPGARPASRRSRSGPNARNASLVTTLTKRLAEDLSRLFPRGRPALQMAALRAGRHRARAGAARAARGGVRRAGRRQPACAKGSICRRCRWWRSSTPTRKAFCAAERR